MAISFSSAKTVDALAPFVLPPATDNATTVEPLSANPQTDTSVVVTLGTGIQATFVYNANGVLKEVVFGPPLASTLPAAQATPAANTAETTTAAPLVAVPTTVANVATAAIATEVVQALTPPTTTPAALPAEQITATTAVLAAALTPATAPAIAPVATPVVAVAVTPAAATQNTPVNTLQQEALSALAVNTIPASANPALANALVIEQTLAIAQATPNVAPPALQITPATTAAAPAAATTVPVPTTAQGILVNAIQQENAANTQLLATPQPVTPTTAAIDATLQDLFLQSANLAVTNITANPSYANSLAALILGSGNANIRLIDETGVLFPTSEPVLPIRGTAASRAVA